MLRGVVTADILSFPNVVASCRNCHGSIYEDDKFNWLMSPGVGVKYLCKTCLKDDCAVCNFHRFAKHARSHVFDQDSKPVVLKYKNPLEHDSGPH
jgi:hypothetical protein